MLTPLYGFLRGDVVGLLVLVHDHEPVSAIAAKLRLAAAVRVDAPAALEVWHGGRRLDPMATVAGAGLTALVRVDVIPAGDDPGWLAAP